MKKIGIVCLSMCILLAGCSEVKEAETIELLEPVSVNVDTAIVRADEIYSVAAYPAYVIPYTEELSFSVPGYIESLEVVVGDTVEEGQVLATLDESSLISRIEELKDTIANAKKNDEFNNALAECEIEISKVELIRLGEELETTSEATERKDLQLSINIKKVDLTIAETKLAQAKELQEYELIKPEQELTELTAELGQNTLKAPFSGEVVSISNISERDLVDANRVILVVADASQMMIESEFIPESVLENCSRYYALHNNTELEISYVPMNINEYLKLVLSGGEPNTSFTIKKQGNSLAFGNFVSICIMKDYKKDVLVVPAKAIYKDAQEDYVYVMKGETKVRQQVEVGITTDISVEITDGLVEGDEVYVKN